jgi:hypothetical protein
MVANAAGLNNEPTQRTLESTQADSSIAMEMFAFGGRRAASIVQLTSKAQGSTVLYVAGRTPAFLEFANKAAATAWFGQRLASDEGSDLLAHFDDLPVNEDGAVEFDTQASPPPDSMTNDIFDMLLHAQRTRAMHAVDTPPAPDMEPWRNSDDADTLVAGDGVFAPLDLALTLTVTAPPISEEDSRALAALPTPEDTARRLIREKFPGLDPDHTFVKCVVEKRTPDFWEFFGRDMDLPLVPPPDTAPRSLAEALLTNYRVVDINLRPDARNVVYTDPTGEGTYDPAKTVRADNLNSLLAVDLAKTYDQEVREYWKRHGGTVERSFQARFIAQANGARRDGELSEDGLKTVTRVLDQIQVPSGIAQNNAVQISSPRLNEVSSPAIMILRDPSRSSLVLYQPDVVPPFQEFGNDQFLRSYLKSAATKEVWRNQFMAPVPLISHEALNDTLQRMGVPRVRHTLRTSPYPSAPDLEYDLPLEAVTGNPFRWMKDKMQLKSELDGDELIVSDGEQRLSQLREAAAQWQLALAIPALIGGPFVVPLLVATAASAALNLYAASSPETGSENARSATISAAMDTFALTLGLAAMAPRTAKAVFRSLRKPSRMPPTRGAGSSTMGSRTGSLPRDTAAMSSGAKSSGASVTRGQRKTQLEPFFGSSAYRKVWRIPGNARMGQEDVKVWKLGKHFQLWTGEKAQAKTLVVSSHGEYFNPADTALIPANTAVKPYGPHDFALYDPGLQNVASGLVKPYATVTPNSINLHPSALTLGKYNAVKRLYKNITVANPADPVAIAGTSQPGRMTNYVLSKYQHSAGESYQNVADVVRQSHVPGAGNGPVDVLTVRNRTLGMEPTLKNLFNELHNAGIHYDEILLVCCRNDLNLPTSLVLKYSAPRA